MSKRKSIAIVVGVLSFLAILLFPRSASAHHPEVEATAVCSEGLALITAHTYAWQSDPARRTNNTVVVSLQTSIAGIVVGSFTAANNYEFNAEFIVPANGQTHIVRSTGVDSWGPNGEFGSAGDYRETTVTVPTNCVPNQTIPTTTILPPTPPSTVPSTTIGPPPSSNPPVTSIPEPVITSPTTTVDVPVSTITTTTIPVVPTSVERQPTTSFPGGHGITEHPRTGFDTAKAVYAAILVALFGTGLWVLGRRADNKV